MKNKKLIAANPGGIANRIKCLVSMWRISEKFNTEFYLNWKRNNECGAYFNHLFENDFILVCDEEVDKMKDKVVSQTHRFITFKNEIPDSFARVFPTKKGNNIDFEFNRIPQNVRENIYLYLNRLKPIKVIQSIADNFISKYDVKNLVGIHIRRGDFLVGKEGLGKVSSDDKFIEKMNELLKVEPSARFFLCTDCKDTEDKFVKIFGDKIILYKKKNFDRKSIIFTQQGLVDLLILAKTKHIVGTYRSTYTELAWWFGKCKAKVTIIMDDDLNRQYEENDLKLKKSKYQKFKRFIYKIKKRVFGK